MNNIRISIVFIIFVFLCSCAPRDTAQQPAQPDLTLLVGSYVYGRNISSDTLYREDEAPIFIFDEDTLVLFRRDLAYFSPLSSGGRYQGTMSSYDLSGVTEDPDYMDLLKSANINLSGIECCHRFPIEKGSIEVLLVGEKVWVAQWWRSETPYIFELEQAGQYKLLDGDDPDHDYSFLIDTSYQQSLNILSPNFTKEDILSITEQDSEEKQILVALKSGADYTSYTVFEFERNNLKARTEYIFWNSYIAYEAAKPSALFKNGNFNDSLMLLQIPYAGEVDLALEFRGLNYDELMRSLIDYSYLIISDGTSEEHIRSLAAQAIEESLLNQKPIYYVAQNRIPFYQATVYLSEILPNEPSVTNAMFAVVDMDGDRIPEVIVQKCNFQGYVVLRYYNDLVYGYDLNYRSLINTKLDGSYYTSGGSDINSISKMVFLGEYYDCITMAYSTGGYNNKYYFGDVAVDEHDYMQILEGFEKLPDVVWRTYNTDGVNRWLRDDYLSIKCAMTSKATVLTMQCYLNSLANLIDCDILGSYKEYYKGWDRELDKMISLCIMKLKNESADKDNFLLNQQLWIEKRNQFIKDNLGADLDLKLGDITKQRTYRLLVSYLDNQFYEMVIDP